MPLTLAADDPRITWQGQVSLQRAEDWVMPWRLPVEQLGLFPPTELQGRAATAAGVRLAFRSDTTTVSCLVAPQIEEGQVDLYCDGEAYGSASACCVDRFGFEGMPAGDKLVELWLPHFAELRLRGLELDEGASVGPAEDGRPRWVTYGSSITHCRSAAGPSTTWPAIVARERSLDLTCLGYGGNCHLEPMVARMIRGLPADFLSMKVGINVYGAATLGPRTFRAAIIGFVRILREGHPETPLAVASPVASPPRERTENAVGFTLQSMREEVADAVEALRAHGDRNVHYVDGLRLFGHDLAHLLPDDLHPNAEGYERLAHNFIREVADPLFAGRADQPSP